MKIFSACAMLFASLSLFASYPTQWLLQNRSGSDVAFFCESGRIPGLYTNFEMPEQNVAAFTNKTYAWRGIHNDGMGLNAASWSCSAKTLTAPNNTVATTSFRTGWGEDITLRVVQQGSTIMLRLIR